MTHKTILWDSCIGGSQSLGVVGEQTVLALDRAGFTTIIRPWNFSRIFRAMSFETHKESRESGYKWGNDATSVMLPETRRLITSSMEGVSTDCNYTWLSLREVALCNKLDFLFVPSNFVKNVAIDSGVKAPIRVWPHGVDTSVFYPMSNQAGKGTDEIYAFLFVGVVQERKGVEELLTSFERAFDKGERDVRLIIKSSNWGSTEVYRKNHPDSRIVWMDNAMSQGCIADRIRSAMQPCPPPGLA